ncbi:Aste57867_14006 [Aphanomyces stellatus]|uniref:Aste57867_14006 protein n=1 Tax=Aphanomyces stellatus TaxID=120398 RepID=A0A485L0I4_9STRA|nr:hypothetical protein As57867_013955 [Aphanomyces stellatus]VFT90836.1 Aste57867_14006 [Aphanomyces stellatus]
MPAKRRYTVAELFSLKPLEVPPLTINPSELVAIVGQPADMTSLVTTTCSGVPTLDADVERFTSYALKHLVKQDAYHVADIVGKTKVYTQDADLTSYVNCIVERMQQDPRLQFDVDGQGRRLFRTAGISPLCSIRRDKQPWRESIATDSSCDYMDDSFVVVQSSSSLPPTTLSDGASSQPSNSRRMATATLGPSTHTTSGSRLTPLRPRDGSADRDIVGHDEAKAPWRARLLALRVDDAVAKFTAIALKRLVKHDEYHVADIVAQTQQRGLSSSDVLVDRVVARMAQDPRLEYAMNAIGRRVFRLRGREPLSSSQTDEDASSRDPQTKLAKPAPGVEIAFAGTPAEWCLDVMVGQFATVAIEYLEAHWHYPTAYYPVSHVMTNVKLTTAAARGGREPKLFFEQIVAGMKDDARLVYGDVDEKGRPGFKLKLPWVQTKKSTMMAQPSTPTDSTIHVLAATKASSSLPALVVDSDDNPSN